MLKASMTPALAALRAAWISRSWSNKVVKVAVSAGRFRVPAGQHHRGVRAPRAGTAAGPDDVCRGPVERGRHVLQDARVDLSTIESAGLACLIYVVLTRLI